jgi:hypothetical protein
LGGEVSPLATLAVRIDVDPLSGNAADQDHADARYPVCIGSGEGYGERLGDGRSDGIVDPGAELEEWIGVEVGTI